MKKYTHPCSKCQTPYQDTDPDPYFCTKCTEERKQIAKKVDGKMSTVGQQPSGLFIQYEKADKIKGLVTAKQLLSFDR